MTCLARNGRVDTNIINVGNAAATYRLAFEGLSPRESVVASRDWWRSPITGRPDGDYTVTVLRNGAVVSSELLTVACDVEPPQVSGSEIQIVNACRGGNGYALFQFANPTAEPRGWVIEFDGVPNRSTGAQPHGAAVRAVTGRPNGEHAYAIRVGFDHIAAGTITVDC